jgi:hypothetical protein
MITRNYILVLIVGISVLGSYVRAVDDEGNLDGGRQKLKSIQDLHEAQARLERAYKAALSDEQKAWLAYADSVIAYFYPSSNNDWGSGTVTYLNLARIRLIEDRIHVLTPGDVYQ